MRRGGHRPARRVRTGMDNPNRSLRVRSRSWRTAPRRCAALGLQRSDCAFRRFRFASLRLPLQLAAAVRPHEQFGPDISVLGDACIVGGMYSQLSIRRSIGLVDAPALAATCSRIKRKAHAPVAGRVLQFDESLAQSPNLVVIVFLYGEPDGLAQTIHFLRIARRRRGGFCDLHHQLPAQVLVVRLLDPQSGVRGVLTAVEDYGLLHGSGGIQKLEQFGGHQLRRLGEARAEASNGRKSRVLSPSVRDPHAGQQSGAAVLALALVRPWVLLRLPRNRRPATVASPDPPGPTTPMRVSRTAGSQFSSPEFPLLFWPTAKRLRSLRN